MAEVPYPKCYGLWTNKGGVGKSTLSYHLSTCYAELFPEKVVLLIDMSPQANSSATLLTKTSTHEVVRGDERVKWLHDNATLGTGDYTYPRTIGGYLAYVFLTSGVARCDLPNIEAKEWLVNIRSEHNQAPRNMKLLCGDSCLDLLVPTLTASAGSQSNNRSEPFVNTHKALRLYVHQLAKYYKAKEGKELVVFIDTDPAFSIYTAMAVCAMTDLVVPVNADDYSLQAVRNLFHYVYGLYPSDGPAAGLENQTFAAKAKIYRLELPKVAAIIHNRNPILRENRNQRAVNPQAFEAINQETLERLFLAYIKARNTGELDRVFTRRVDANNQPIIFRNDQEQAFGNAYTASIRDMRSCGVAATHSGFPLWVLLERYASIDRKFKKKNFAKRVPSLMKDMIFAMKVIFGRDVWNSANVQRRQRLEALAGLTEDAAENIAGQNGAGAGGNQPDDDEGDDDSSEDGEFHDADDGDDEGPAPPNPPRRSPQQGRTAPAAGGSRGRQQPQQKKTKTAAGAKRTSTGDKKRKS